MCSDRVILSFLFLALLAPPFAASELVASGSDSGVRPTGALYSGRSAVLGRNGMVAASHPLAAQVGLRILRQGGSAVDAAIATNALLSVVEPYDCGPGGDLFAIVWDPKTRKLHGLNASGRAPRGATLELVRTRLAEDAQSLPFLGPLTVTVPGAVDGWYELHRKFGKLPMEKLLAPAVEYARSGVPVPEIIASDWAWIVDRLIDSPELEGELENFRRTYLPSGQTPRKGEIFRNPELATFYERLGSEGRDYFYKGEAAEIIAERVTSAGGFLTKADLESHRSDWVEPVSVSYRGYEVFEMPPNGQGIAALQMLKLLEPFNLAAMGRTSADFWHVMIEAKKVAYEDRARHYADPDFMSMPVSHLLSEAYAAKRRKHIDMNSVLASVEPGAEPIEEGDTVYLAAADSEGMMVSFIQSVAGPFGSWLVPDGLGFPLQNRGWGFSLEPGHPNAYAPGKRPFHTIIPAFVMKDDTPWLAFGVMGGAMQPQGHVQVLVNLIDFGMDLQAAGDAARFRHSGSSQPGTAMVNGGLVSLEPGVPQAVVDKLIQRGHAVELYRGSAYGGYQAIARDANTGVLTGATEMRQDGAAVAY